MKKSTINTITTILGVAIILASIPLCIVLKDNILTIIGGCGVLGIVLIYVKNGDAIALLKSYFK